MIELANVITAYGAIQVLKDRAAGSILYRQGDSYQSESDDHGVSRTAYVHAMYGLLLQSRCHDVLMIGCGGGVLATMLHAAGIRVAIVDINPWSFRLAREFFHLPGDVDCHVQDGRTFLLANRRRYDAIVLDAFVGDQIPDQFTNRAFFRIAKTRMRSKQGCLFANLHVAHDLDRKPDQFTKAMSEIWSVVRLLDARGTVNRNAIAMAGAVQSLKRPALITLPKTGADEIAGDLERLEFRSWAAP